MLIIAIFVSLILLANLWVQRKSKTMKDVVKNSSLVGFILVCVFQVAAYLHSGFLDPFVLIAVFVQMAIAMLVGLSVGLGYIKFQKPESMMSDTIK